MKKLQILLLTLLIPFLGYTQCPTGNVDVVINIETDSYPGETYWMVFAHQIYGVNAGDTIAQVPAGYFTSPNTNYYDTICLPPMAHYAVLIRDTWGDGLISGGINVIECGTDTAWSFGPASFTGYYTTLGWPDCGPNLPLGCTDSTAQNWNPTATIDDGSCLYIVGCTDSLALNYDSLAQQDDGSCLFVYGCMDVTAINYNPAAITDDGSCMGGSNGTTCGQDTTKVIVQINVDNYPSEIGWVLTNYTTGDTLYNVPTGTYSGQSPLTLNLVNLCIADNTILQFTINDSYGDGLAGSLWGGVDGNWSVISACGQIISQGSGDFGNFQTDTSTLSPCIPPQIIGCMDNAYVEFNPLANINDSTLCQTFKIYGCTDPTSFNYNPSANTMQQNSGCDNIVCLTDWAGDGWFGSFIYIAQGANYWGPFTVATDSFITQIPLITGMPVKAFFYSFGQSSLTAEQCAFKIINPLGTVILEGGTNPYTDPIVTAPYMYSANTLCGNTCIPSVYGCTDSTATNYNPLANTTDNSCYYNPGCLDAAYLQYHTQGYIADYDDGSCLTYAIFGCMDTVMFNYDEYATVQWTSVVDQNNPCIAKIFGCMDPTAFNYNPLANTEDYTCISVIYGCMDMSMFNYDPTANTDNNSCIAYIFGCTDSTSLNYDILSNTDDGSCIPYLYGCTDSTALNFNNLANTDDGSCVAYLYGCTDSTSTNYNILANTDDGSCIPFIYGCTDSTAFNYNPLANTNNGCIPYIYGCTDPTMFNYDPIANTLDNSCIPFIYGCTDPSMFNYNSNANTNNNSCIPYLYGCTDTTMFNYDPTANTDNGSCLPYIYGCTDNTSLNFDPLANTLDNSCCYIGGCTDLTAVNYNPNACYDDNSCIVAITGCTDVSAYNYNPAANVSDSLACLYDADCYGGPGIPYWLNDGCYAWVIDVDDYCCTNDWDASCQSMYDYCQLGWPTAIEDIGVLGIVIYPNPTKDLIYIETRLNIEIEIYDMMGKLLFNMKNTSNRIDISNYSPGIYNMTIIYENKRYSKKIIKE